MSNRFGVSSWLPPAELRARTSYSREGDRVISLLKRHPKCSFEGFVDVFQCAFGDLWRCECGEDVAEWCDMPEDDDAPEMAHVDEDFLDGPAEHFGWHGKEAS